MKSIQSNILTHALLVLASLTPVALHAAAINESFDTKPSAPIWNMAAQARVVGGELLLSAVGLVDGYATTALAAKAGNQDLNFTEKFVKITFTDLNVGGKGTPADNVFMAIIASDVPSESKARSYLKLRLSGDGRLMLNCADASGDGSRETSLGEVQVALPVSQLVIQLTVNGFQVQGMAASRPFETSGRWAGKIDMDAWQGRAPYLTIKAVCRPGKDQTDVRLGGLSVASE